MKELIESIVRALVDNPEQVEVQEVIGARLASVRVLDGEGKIQPGDRLRLMGAEDQ